MHSRRSLAAAILIAAVIATIAVVLPVARTVLLRLQLPASQAAGERALSLWRVTGPESGGFASLAALDPPLDLYASAWNLRLLRVYRITVPAQLDRDRMREALRKVIEDPGSVTTLPRLEALHLAVSAAHDLGLPVPADSLRSRLSELRIGAGYTLELGTPASDAALTIAVDTMVLAGIPVSGDTKNEVRSQLAASATHSTLQELADSTIPIWMAADQILSSEERSKAVATVTNQLDQLWTTLAESAAWDGAMLALASDALEIARSNGIRAPRLDSRAWAALVRADGYLAVTAESSEGDPQTTMVAALLGRPAPEILARAVSVSAGARGWQSTPVQGPETTAMAEFVLEKLNLDTHHNEVLAQCNLWLAWLRHEVRDADSLRRHLRDLASYNAVADIVGATTWMPDLPAWAPDSSWSRQELGWLVRALFVVENDASDLLVHGLVELNRQAPRSTQDALDIYLVGTLANRADLQGNAIRYLETVQMGEFYRANREVEQPDLRSTAAAYAVLGKTSISAARRFATDAGFALTIDPSLDRDAGTVESLFLAVGLATGFDSPALLP